jgi:hypothetical protein
MTTTPTAADELADIARAVRRLRPDWRDAEAFYELRSEIAGALMRLARRLNGHAYATLPARPPPARPIALAVDPSRRQTPPAPPTDAETVLDLAHASHNDLLALLKQRAPAVDAGSFIASWIVSVRATELAILLSIPDSPEDRQLAVDAFNDVLSLTSLGYRLTPLS